MPSYTINHTCGHDEQMQLMGFSPAAIPGYLARKAAEPCRPCDTWQQKAARRKAERALHSCITPNR